MSVSKSESVISWLLDHAGKADEVVRKGLFRYVKVIFEGRLQRGETGELGGRTYWSRMVSKRSESIIYALSSRIEGHKIDPIQEKMKELRTEFNLREQHISQLNGRDLYRLIGKLMNPRRSLLKILKEYPKSQTIYYIQYLPADQP